MSAPASQAQSTGQYTIGAYDATVNTRELGPGDQAGTLTTAYDVDRWTLAADTGQALQFHLINESSPSVVFTLTAPDGSALLNAVNADSQVLTLSERGAYTLTVRSTGSTGGSYAFRLLDATVQDLSLNAPVTGNFADDGQTQLYRIQVPVAGPLSILLTDPSKSDHTELYARFGNLPTRQTYDAAADGAGSSQSVLIASATTGTWYVLVYADSVGRPPSGFTIEALAGHVVISNVAPVEGAANASTTLTVTGAPFSSGSVVSLVLPTGVAYQAGSSSIDLPTQITATFTANSVPPGTYSVEVTQSDGSSATYPGAFTMSASGYAALSTHLELPNAMTRHVAQTLYIDYSNTGNVAMAAPLLVLTATNPLGQQGALLTLNPALQGEGLWTNNTPVGYSQSVEVLASGATPGVLQPGESGRVPVYYAGWLRSQWEFSQSTLNFSLDAIQADDSRPMNWDGATYVSGNSYWIPRSSPASPGFLGPFAATDAQIFVPFTAVIPWVDGAPPSETQVIQEIDNGTIPLSYERPAPTFLVSFGDQIGTIDNEPGVAQSPPSSIRAAAWGVIASSLQSSVGSTLGNYVQSLDNEAAYLGRLGENVTDVQTLWGFEVQQANNSLNPLAPFLTSVTDDSLSTPGSLSLSFGRVYSESISGRDTIGPLGMGWATSWQTSATANSDGSMTISSPGGGQLTFEPDTRTQGGYFSPLGDTSTLSADGSGGYLLTAADGTQTDFSSGGLLNYMQDTNHNRITAGYSNGQLSSLTASSGQFINLAYNSAGLISSVTDSSGRAIAYQYDPTNTYLVSVIAYNHQMTDYGYITAAGSAQNALTVIALPGGTHQYFTYDSQGRLSGTSGDENAEPQSFAYDLGQVSVTDGAHDTSGVYYNENDQVAKSVDALGNPTYYSYDDRFNLTRITNAAGQSERYTYNTVGEVTSSTDFLGNTTHFAYSGPFNELTALTDANGNVNGYGYDSAGNLLSTSYADHTSSSSTFNPLGEATSFLNQNGQPISYQYNAAGQVTQESFSDGTSYAYAYDASGNLLTATDATGKTTFTYDPTTQYLTRVDYPGGMFLKFSYNAAGQRTQMVDQTNFTTDYLYDSNGRLSQLTDAAGNVIVTYTYDAAGRLSKKFNGNGTYTSYSYDADGNVLDLINHAPNGTINSSFAYTYNTLGLETSETTIDGQWTYAYDADGQLTHAVFTPNAANPDGLTPQDLTYNYDPMGNRTSTVINGVTTAYTVNNMNEYTSVGGVRYTYDADGNLLTRGMNSFIYNSLNQYIEANTSEGSTSFGYDAFGRRVTSTSEGQATSYVIDPSGLGNVIEAFGQGGAVSRHFTFGFGLLRETLTGGNGSRSDYFSFDALGSVVEQSDPSGNKTASYAYYPFGGPETQVDASQLFGFLGEAGITTESEGTLNMRARDYDPVTGRFISEDPIGLYGDVNDFRYTGNRPNQLIDPSGWRSSLWEDPPEKIQSGEAGYRIGVSLFNTLVNTRWGKAHGLQPIPDDPPPFFSQLPGMSASQPPITYRGPIPKPRPGPTPEPPIPLSSSNQPNPRPGPTPLPALPPGTGAKQSANAVQAVDPNALYGPSGYGAGNVLNAGAFLYSYGITFENAPAATAAAQEVTISDRLAPALDWSTFQLTGITFGSTYLTIPAGSQHFETTVPMTYDGQTFNLQVEAGIRLSTGQVYAIFQSIDPATGLPPANPLIGFLPPEDGSGRGDGSISFTVSPVAGLPTGTQIRNVADITFDQGLTISTDQANDEDPSQGIDPAKQALVTIDAGAPTSRVSALPAAEFAPTFTVNWAGQDDAGGSGVASFNVYVSIDGGTFVPWLANTTQTAAPFTGQSGHTYAFYSVATDNVGNAQPTPASAQAITKVVLVTGDVNADGSVTFADLLVLAQHYGQTGTLADGDVNGDGTVNFGDLLLLAQNYGRSIAAAAGPTARIEPDKLARLFHKAARRR